MSSPIDDELSRFHFSTMVNFHFDLDEPTTEAWVNQENKRLGRTKNQRRRKKK